MQKTYLLQSLYDFTSAVVHKPFLHNITYNKVANKLENNINITIFASLSCNYDNKHCPSKQKVNANYHPN